MPFRRRSRIRSERVEWLAANTVVPASVAVNTAATVSLLTTAVLEEFTQPKLILLLGSMFFSPATAPAAATGYGIFMGLYRRTNVGGGFVTPDPEINGEHPFIYWDCYFPQIGGNGAADSNASRWVGYIPVKLMLRPRIRFRENEELILVVKNSAQSGAAIQFSHAWRFKLAAGRK